MYRIQLAKGDRFGRLTVLNQVRVDAHSERFFKLRCDCGKEVVCRLSNLKRGSTHSCGCLRHELFLKRNTGKTNVSYDHGYHKHPLYQVWQNFKQRCYNPKNGQYRNYGARGITVCKSWVDNPARFVKWGLSHGYQPGLWIDRKDNNGNYTPRNCHFVTPKGSAANQRHHNQYTDLQQEEKA